MEFLVRIHVHLPPDLDARVRDELLARELQRGRELRGAGTIRHIWRLPGALANVGVWETEDATALHEALASLPVFAWTTIEVTPLARHPSTGGPDGSGD
jgi:muconolactone D-isomerase